jgi:hypothetical protein
MQGQSCAAAAKKNFVREEASNDNEYGRHRG